MIRSLLYFIMVMCSLSGISQEPVSGVIVPEAMVPLASDSNYYISDLVHVVKENSKVVINWKLSDKGVPDFFAIERSSNGREFEVISVIRLTENKQWFEFADESPAKGKNLYRIRCASKDSQHIYSKLIHAQIAGDISFKFYPNPVDNILIIRSEDPLDIQILDAGGKIRISQNKVEGLQTINVTSLEKGIYLLRVANRQANTIIQEKLLKN
jgi:hypothetical protein